MKYSMMSYTVARQPRHFDLAKMLRLTRELEMAGIDFVTLHGQPARELRKMADDLGLPVVCYTFTADLDHATAEEREEGREACRAGLEAAAELGAPVAMLPTPNRHGTDRDTSRRNWIAGLAEVCPLAREAGVTLTVENFPGEQSGFVTASDVIQAIEEVPGLKLTYDAGNAGTGENPTASFQKSAKHVVHAHFKDWLIRDEPADGYRRMLDGRYYKPALVGEGDIRHIPTLRAMKSAGYEGCINIEYEGDEYDPYTGVRKAVEYLRSVE